TGSGEDLARLGELPDHALGAHALEIAAEDLEDHTLDVGGLRQHLAQQLPDLVGTGARVGVQVHAVHAETTSEVNLHHPRQVQVAEEFPRVEAMVGGIHVDVVEVEQQATAGAGGQPVQELGLAQVLLGDAEVINV